MRIFALLISVFLILNCQAQREYKFNLNFEEHNDTNGLADGWISWGSYEIKKSSLSIEGVNSVKLTYSDSSEFGCIAFPIPANYHGNKIKLEGYMKTKNVEDGFAGLYLHIVDENNSKNLIVDNMQEQNISGTTAWTKYTIEHDFPEDATTFYIGGILNGKGEAWYDDFTLTIDGKDIQYLEETRTALSKITLDKEFDEGSKVIMPKLSFELIDGIEVLGKVWGFLKYYHPAVAKGEYNWDYELFRFMPNYLQENDKAVKEKLLLNWIDSLGEVEICKSGIPTAKEAVIKPDHKWISESINNDLLKVKLFCIYKNRSQGTNVYVKPIENVNGPKFTNENMYDSMPYPDVGYRVLSLFRYWNIINYYFPSKHLTDKDWETVLKEYIPAFINAKNELEYELVVIRIIADINDSHALLGGSCDKFEEWKGNNISPVIVKFIENKLIVTDYYKPELKEEIGLEIGDIITKINNKKVEDIIKEKSKYYPASNIPTQLRDISMDILRSQNNKINIECIQNGVITLKTINLIPLDSVDRYGMFRKSGDKSYKLLNDNIGYVTLKSIKSEDVDNIKKEFKNTKGIIIDIRNYPATDVMYTLCPFFVTENSPFTRFTYCNFKNPGEVFFGRSYSIASSYNPYKGKLIVIVNEVSQSNAEYTAMAFRAGDSTTIIGSTTAGADGNVSEINLPGGLKTRISGLGIYYADGEQTQRVGIIPDIVVKPTIEGIKNGRDEILEKAIELILE